MSTISHTFFLKLALFSCPRDGNPNKQLSEVYPHGQFHYFYKSQPEDVTQLNEKAFNERSHFYF